MTVAPKLALPQVTLILVDAVVPELSRLALLRCLAKVSFGDVIVGAPHDLGIGRWVECPAFNSRTEADRFTADMVTPNCNTGHFLYIQWDSWILDPCAWRQEFLDYDYIGAPWNYKDGLNVGNGGFCLASSALARFLAIHRAEFPISDSSDNTLCRVYRPTLEESGFRWAPEATAQAFAFEHRPPTEGDVTFGFHGLFNWHDILPRAELEKTVPLFNEYVFSSAPYKLLSKRFEAKYGDLLDSRSAALSVLDDVIKFFPGIGAERFLGSGWSDVENGFVWAIGNQSTLYLRTSLSQKVAKLLLRLELSPFLTSIMPAQRISVWLNKIAIWNGKAEGPFTLILTALASDLDENNLLSIKLIHPDSARPSECIRGHQDERELAVALSSMVVSGINA